MSAEPKKIDELLYEIRSAGYPIAELILDGRVHRFKMDSSDTKESGNYRAYERPFGIEIYVNSFKKVKGLKSLHLISHERELNEAEILEHQKLSAELSKKEEQKKILQWDTRAIEAEHRWARSDENHGHPILFKRWLKAAYGSRADWKALIIPMRDLEGKLWNIEIHGEKRKGMVSRGSRKTGLFHLIGEIKLGEPLFITESFITGASLHQLSGGKAVACSFSASNMDKVALAFRTKYPKIEIIVSGDADEVGKRESIKAAKLVGGRVLIPQFRFTHPDYTDWNDFYKLENEEGIQMAVTQIENYREKSSATAIEDWFSEWIATRGARTTYKGIITVGGEEFEHKAFDSRIFIDAAQVSKSFGNQAKHVIVLWLDSEKKRMKKEIIDRIIGYEPNDELEKFVRAVIKEPQDLALKFIQNFVWHVKRKMIGAPVERHIMPVIVGPQNSGKTTAVERLVAPIEDLVAHKGVNEITDEKAFPMFRDHFVITLDEMSKAGRADVETLKRVITARTLNCKRYYAQDQIHVPNNCTMIGTSNSPLDGIIQDATGMRRFIELFSHDKADFEAVNSMNAIAAWRSVDVNGPCPISDADWGGVAAIQEEMRFKSDVEQWASDENLIGNEQHFTQNSTIYKSYVNWCESNGVSVHYRKSMDYVGKDLARLGFKRDKRAGKRGFMLLISSQFSML